MAWTTPITFVTGNQLLAAQMNTYLRDNTNYLFDPPMCLAQKSTTASISTSSATNVSFNAANLYDTDTMHDNVGAPTLITPNTAGVYFWTADVQFAGNAVGIRWMQIISAAGLPVITHQSELGPSGNPCRLSASGFFPLSAAAIAAVTSFVVTVFQSSGGALNLNGTGAAAAPCYFGARWCGPYP